MNEVNATIAAKMRAQGKSIAEIAEHFGWTEKMARVFIERGRDTDRFNEYQAMWHDVNAPLAQRDY